MVHKKRKSLQTKGSTRCVDKNMTHHKRKTALTVLTKTWLIINEKQHSLCWQKPGSSQHSTIKYQGSASFVTFHSLYWNRTIHYKNKLINIPLSDWGLQNFVARCYTSHLVYTKTSFYTSAARICMFLLNFFFSHRTSLIHVPCFCHNYLKLFPKFTTILALLLILHTSDRQPTHHLQLVCNFSRFHIFPFRRNTILNLRDGELSFVCSYHLTVCLMEAY